MAKAYFQKGEQPLRFWFDVIAAPCRCGEKWWVQPKELAGWVEAEPDETVPTER